MQESLQMKKGRMQKSLYKCDKCKDTGWILKKHEDGTSYAVSCQCREKEKLKQQWKSSGMNLDSINLTFSNFSIWNKFSKALKETAIAYFNDFNKIKNSRQNSLLLSGQPGGGKTHIAVAVAINLINTGIKVIYMPYREALTNLKINIKDENYYRSTLDRYKMCELLMIDDLYKGKVTVADINILFEIVNYRYVNYKPIMVSSEMTIEEILEIDEGIGSRVYEMCSSYIVTIPKNKDNNFRLCNK